MSRPTGTVTFLFTDIEGSTRMWEEHSNEMDHALERHDELLRQAIESAGGYIFSTAGDAFAAAFTEPVTALQAAVTIQRRLREEDWGRLGALAVRMALHTGVAHERDGDYFGPTLNRTARILAAGHGGQVLLSLATEEILGGSLAGMSLRDLGEHTLKDLGRAEHIFQVVAPNLREDFPPLRSLDAHPNNLPVRLTSFVGREVELRDVVKRLRDHRLLTLTGVGGSGKTRLALQAAAEVIDDYPHGVWLVELAPITDPGLIASAIGEALGITRGAAATQPGDQSFLDHVTAYLKARTALLVLDNCEHLIAAAARVVQHLLQRCPLLTVLTTSREGLGIPGEALWQVPSLGSAPATDPVDNDAVRLFVERAQDVDPGFDTGAEALYWVQRICGRLDGLPLAIELAAARARVLDPRQIAERLDDSFRLLTGGSRTALPRHQTLQAAVDWSFDLMLPTECILFRRLATFRGGFTLAAAEAVCAGGEIDPDAVLDLLGSLVDKSMVVRDEIGGRFRMLETLRQYALAKLTASAEVDAVQIRHSEFFRQFISEQAPQLRDAGEIDAYAAITNDHDNLRAALAFCFENGHEDTALQIAVQLAWYWWLAAGPDEPLEWLRKALPFVDRVDTRTASVAFGFAGFFAACRTDPDAAALAAEGVARARATGDDWALAVCLNASCMDAGVRYDYEANKVLGLEMLAAATRAADLWLIGQAEFIVGFCDRLMSRLEDAARHLEAAEDAFRRQKSPSGLAWCLVACGQVARYRSDFETEVAKQREARKIFTRIGAPAPIAHTLINEGIALTLLGRPAEAVPLGRRGVATERNSDVTDSFVERLVLVAWFEQEAGNHREALDLYEEALRIAEAALDRFTVSVIAEYLRGLLALLENFDEAARCEGYFEANQSRPEPEIYTRHFAALQTRYHEALGTRLESLRGEGAAMTPRVFRDHASLIVAAEREGLEVGLPPLSR